MENGNRDERAVHVIQDDYSSEPTRKAKRSKGDEYSSLRQGKRKRCEETMLDRSHEGLQDSADRLRSDVNINDPWKGSEVGIAEVGIDEGNDAITQALRMHYMQQSLRSRETALGYSNDDRVVIDRDSLSQATVLKLVNDHLNGIDSVRQLMGELETLERVQKYLRTAIHYRKEEVKEMVKGNPDVLSQQNVRHLFEEVEVPADSDHNVTDESAYSSDEESMSERPYYACG